MDEMIIQSKWFTGLLQKILLRILRKKMGCNPIANVNSIRVTTDDTFISAHIDVDLHIKKEELTKLILQHIGDN